MLYAMIVVILFVVIPVAICGIQVWLSKRSITELPDPDDVSITQLLWAMTPKVRTRALKGMGYNRAQRRAIEKNLRSKYGRR